MVLGICKWCFEPVWKDDKSKVIGNQVYHHNCSFHVEQWQKDNNKDWIKHIIIKAEE